MSENLFSMILERAKKARKRIGVGIVKTPNRSILESLKKASEFMDLVIYGIKINGFECRVFDDSQQAAIEMVSDFRDGRIDQFVRGQVDDFSTVETFKKQFNIDEGVGRIDVALLEDADGWQFFLTGASNPDLQTLDEKIRVVDGLTDWLGNEFGLKLKVAVMATCRPGSYGRDPVMSKTYDEAEAVVKHLNVRGIEAKNVHIEIEAAKAWGANLILPARGTIGNQIFRVLYYLGHGRNYLTPTIFPGVGIYEDNSRNETDYFPHLMFALSIANKG